MDAHPTSPHPLMLEEDMEAHKEVDRLDSGSTGEDTQLTDSLDQEVPSLASNKLAVGVQGQPGGASGDESSVSHEASSPQHETQATPGTEIETEVEGRIIEPVTKMEPSSKIKVADTPKRDIPHEQVVQTGSPPFPLSGDILLHSLRPALHEAIPLPPSRSVKEKQKAHVQFQERPPRVRGRPLGMQGRNVGRQAVSQRYITVCMCSWNTQLLMS